jgi:hypothetical protein
VHVIAGPQFGITVRHGHAPDLAAVRRGLGAARPAAPRPSASSPRRSSISGAVGAGGHRGHARGAAGIAHRDPMRAWRWMPMCSVCVAGNAAMAAALGGLDTLVFTGGVGERSAPVRAPPLQAWLPRHRGGLGAQRQRQRRRRHRRRCGSGADSSRRGTRGPRARAPGTRRGGGWARCSAVSNPRGERHGSRSCATAHCPEKQARRRSTPRRLPRTRHDRLDQRRTGTRFLRAERKRRVTLPLSWSFRAGVRRWRTSSARGGCARP